MPTSEANLTRSLMYMIDMMMSSAVEDEKAAKENKNLRVWIIVCSHNAFFLHSCVAIPILNFYDFNEK